MNARKVLGFGAGPLGSAIIGFVSVPAITRAFSAEDVGRLNLMQILMAFATIVFSLGLDQAYVREYHETSPLNRRALLASCMSPGMLLLFVFAIPSVIFARDLATWIFGLPDPKYMWLAIACVFSAYISRFLSLILRMEERALPYSLAQLLSKAILLVLVGGLILIPNPREFLQLQTAFFVSVLMVLCICGWATRAEWRATYLRLDKSELRGLLSYGAPLVLAGFTYWGLSATSSLALRSLSSFEQLGIYSVSMSVAGVAMLAQAIFSLIWAPVVFRWAAKGLDMARVNRVAQQALALVCLILVLAGALSWSIDWILPSQYSEVKYLVLGSLGQPLLYMLSEITSIGINITRRTMMSLWATVGGLLTNSFLSYILVPAHGATGAVVANAVAYFVFFVGRTEASAFVWHPFARKRLYLFTSGAIVLSVLSVALGPRIGDLMSVVWLALLPLVIWSFRHEWRWSLRALRRMLPDLRASAR